MSNRSLLLISIFLSLAILVGGVILADKKVTNDEWSFLAGAVAGMGLLLAFDRTKGDDDV